MYYTSEEVNEELHEKNVENKFLTETILYWKDEFFEERAKHEKTKEEISNKIRDTSNSNEIEELKKQLRKAKERIYLMRNKMNNIITAIAENTNNFNPF